MVRGELTRITKLQITDTWQTACSPACTHVYTGSHTLFLVLLLLPLSHLSTIVMRLLCSLCSTGAIGKA